MAVPSFFINCGDSDFLSRQKNVFDSLDSVEKEKNVFSTTEPESVEIEEKKAHKWQRKKTKSFRGQESLFNKPVDLPPRFKRRNKVPDFQRNPHKWTKYSLGDITQDDMSNESNTAAAMSFLRDIKLQKMKANVKMEVDDECETEPSTHSRAHTFNRTIKTEFKSADDEKVEEVQPAPNSHFRNSKLIMAEYVVGQEKKRAKTARKKVKIEKGKEIFLNHIHEYEDE